MSKDQAAFQSTIDNPDLDQVAIQLCPADMLRLVAK
jgi:hypothetical protein